MIDKYPRAYKAIFNIIKEFKKHYKKSPLRIEVLKLLYLLDLDYYKRYGEKYSEIDYIYYNFGPWAQEFHSIIDNMKGYEISETQMATQDGRPFYLYSTTGRKPRHEAVLEPEASEILTDLFFIYQYSQLKQMLKVVYSQEPMVSTEKDSPIDFSKVPLEARERRRSYKQKREMQLRKVTSLKNNMEEDDLEIFKEFKALRYRANSTL